MRRLPARSPADPTDDDLMARVAARDGVALGLLYDRYARRALAVATAVCPASHAEEAVQEAFLAVWRNGSSYRPERGSVAAWTMRIVHNRSVDLARRQARHADRRADADALAAAAAPADTAGQVIGRSEAAELRNLLAELPAAQREVITLAYFGQLSQAEIADHLELAPGTVKGRMRLGLQKLRGHADSNAA